MSGDKGMDAAFPYEVLTANGRIQHPGCTKREIFAAQIMAGMNASLVSTADWPGQPGAIGMAENAVMQADALLDALSRPRDADKA